MGPLVWVFIAAAVTSLVGGLLAVLGWARGELSGSPWAPLMGVLIMATGFGAVSFRCASTAEPKGEPPEAPDDTVLEVRSPLGPVFWVFATVAAVVLAVTASGVGRFIRRAIQHGGLDRPGTTGLAAVGMTVVSAMALVGMVSVAVAIPIRTIRSYGRTHFWLSHEGIGYPPPSEDDPGFRRWDGVTAVTHSSRDARGVVYTHVWTIRTTNPRLHTTVVYPAGAAPRPRMIRQAIRDLAPAVEVS
ncbi:hypothetical protein [Mycobacterium sp. NPDC050441]|uniref:hypothetical protein n=1 Tax=Mycobacterium sp. NPDC050441 TaxID=3155403 RepID=UPI0033D3E0E1